MQRRFTLSLRKSASNRSTKGIAQKNELTSDRPPPASSSPVPSQLDRVLQKAANKHKLAHPAAPPLQPQPQEAHKEQAARSRNPKPHAQSLHQNERKQAVTQQRKPELDVNDDALFSGITERERDSVWQAIRQEVEGSSGNEDDAWRISSESRSQSTPARRRAAPASARHDGPQTSGLATSETAAQPVASSSGFKGFGSPSATRSDPAGSATALSRLARDASGPQAAGQITPPSPSSSQRQAQAQAKAQQNTRPDVRNRQMQHRQGPQPSSPSSSSGATTSSPSSKSGGQSGRERRGPLRVFLYNAEEERTRSLLVELGMAGRVEVVGDLRSADMLLAAKVTRAGKHVNLVQGERTAANAGIPFVVVGRNMSADNLKAALEPLLQLDPAEAAEVVAARAAASRNPTAAEIRAHRQEMMRDFGQLLFGDASS